MSRDGTYRTFLAIDPPESVRREMGRIQEQLKRTVRGTVRWVRPEGIHLTLKFFGDITGDDITRIADAVEEEAATAKPLELQVKTIGVFPDLKRPRVVWLGMEGDVDRLLALQKELDRRFAALGFPKEDRPFRAHLTLGRIKTPKGLSGVAQAVEQGAWVEAGSFRAEGLTLFQSDLKPAGAVYTKLAE
ncbi:MAG: RNA 2',3'-cyclic phosphodiesterase, partial [Candidatus Aminicenantes bacterium]|nr:RNA 2',3'-cyclic phosphodiesterase [Candidatus Aminicenantes bacterium]